MIRKMYRNYQILQDSRVINRIVEDLYPLVAYPYTPLTKSSGGLAWSLLYHPMAPRLCCCKGWTEAPALSASSQVCCMTAASPGGGWWGRRGCQILSCQSERNCGCWCPAACGCDNAALSYYARWTECIPQWVFSSSWQERRHQVPPSQCSTLSAATQQCAAHHTLLPACHGTIPMGDAALCSSSPPFAQLISPRHLPLLSWPVQYRVGSMHKWWGLKPFGNPPSAHLPPFGTLPSAPLDLPSAPLSDMNPWILTAHFKPPQLWWRLPMVFTASANTHARCLVIILRGSVWHG